MRCPKCGKDVDLQKKQVGVDENGKPIFNEYAVCKDCKKQWNLDKQREKKAANANASNHTQSSESTPVKVKTAAGKSSAARPADGKPNAKNVSVKKEIADDTQVKTAPQKKSPVPTDGKSTDSIKKVPTARTSASDRQPADAVKKPSGTPKKPANTGAEPGASAKRTANASAESGVPAKRTAKTSAESGVPARKTASAPNGRPAPAKRPASAQTTGPVSKANTGQKPVQKRKPVSADTSSQNSVKTGEEQRYGNIPPEKVRAKRERAVKDSYEDMLATDPNRKPVKKKRPAPAEDASPKKRPASSESAPVRKKPAAQPIEQAPQPKEEPAPKLRAFRIIFGIISIAAFAFFAYKGFVAGLDNISAGTKATTGTIYIVLALCMLVSGLLLLIMQKKHTIFAFVLPMIFYAGGAVFAFLKRGDDKFLFYGSIAGAALAVIFLALTIVASRDRYEDDDYEDDYDDPFEDDHDNY